MNSNTHTSRAARSVIETQIVDPERRHLGRVFPAKPVDGHFATVVPGERITLHGSTPGGRRSVQDPMTGRWAPNARPVLHAVTFSIGDAAVYHAFNVEYLGTITSIGPKRVTIVAYKGTKSEKAHKLCLSRFDHYNWDFDLAKIQKRNDEWRD